MRAFLVVTLLACACGAPPRIPDRNSDQALAAGAEGRFSVFDPDHQNWRDRSFIIRVPKGYDGDEAAPVLFAFHGGGGNAEGAFKLTCKDGNTFDDSCLSKLADEEGFVVVAPEGTPAVLLPNHRTWNAGGTPQDEEFRCVSGRACTDQVDDVAFFDALLHEVERGVNVDASRVFLTGMSNGAAMSHRLACERSTVVAAIAVVGGGNQQQVADCSPARPVPVLQIHGDDDPCWRFSDDDDTPVCGGRQQEKVHVSIEATVEGWRARNGCADEAEEDDVDDDADDGMTSTSASFPGCLDGADVTLITVKGGGHTWPRGWGYLGEDIIGKTTQDFSANRKIWDFLDEHPLP